MAGRDFLEQGFGLFSKKASFVGWLVHAFVVLRQSPKVDVVGTCEYSIAQSPLAAGLPTSEVNTLRHTRLSVNEV